MNITMTKPTKSATSNLIPQNLVDISGVYVNLHTRPEEEQVKAGDGGSVEERFAVVS